MSKLSSFGIDGAEPPRGVIEERGVRMRVVGARREKNDLLAETASTSPYSAFSVGKRRVDKSSDGAVDVVAKDRRAEEPETIGHAARCCLGRRRGPCAWAGWSRPFVDSTVRRFAARSHQYQRQRHLSGISTPAADQSAPHGLLRRIRVIENGKALGDEEALVVYFCKVLAGVVLLKEALDNGALHCEL